MTLTLNYATIAYLIAVVFGTIISVICWLHPNNKRSAIRWLGISMAALTWTMFVLFLSESRLIFYLPHLFQTSFATTLIYLPFSYFFVRSVLKHSQLTWKDLIHAAPLLIFLVDYASVYMLPAADKLRMMESSYDFAYSYLQGSFIPPKLHLPLRFVLFLFYLGLQFRLALISTSPDRGRITYYLIFQLTLVLYYTISQFSIEPAVWRDLNVVISLYLVLISILLLFHPRILYSYQFSLHKGFGEREKRSVAHETEGSNERKLQELEARLEAYMKEKSPFLQQGYSINDLSAALEIPTYQLSAFLNHYKGVSFNEFLNKFRILHSMQKIKEGRIEHLTLEALAFESGFSNRNSFTSAFKQVSGMTPSEYIRSSKHKDLKEGQPTLGYN